MFEGNPKHGTKDRPGSNRAPKDGQAALDNSAQVKPTSPRRIGVDRTHDEIVVLDRTTEGRFHGHVRIWEELTDQQRAALVRNNLTDRRGNIIKTEDKT